MKTDLPISTIAEREAALLAPYAMHSADSRGRQHAEAEHRYRGPFQRDRDRIVHSSAFRRLSGKMQVFTGDMGDYHRTRLTHTHEVASIARTIGRALRLNEDLIEALALFHDIGHPPFGHAGEDALDECLAGHGGFSHNEFALTLAEELESRYPAFPGLNLTFEVLEGQATRSDKDAAYATTGLAPLLEVQVVEAADSVTYDAHDTDDAVKLRLVVLDELASCSLVREALETVRSTYANLREDLLRKAVVHQLIDRQVTDVLETSAAILATSGDMTAQEVRRSAIRITASRELSEQKHELERFLYDQVYRHPRLIEVRALAQGRLKQMFDKLCLQPELLPPHFQKRARTVPLPRAVGDYLAGMTDRFCDQQYQRLCETSP
jgi:dGTPase